MEELKINQDTELYDLETLITEGVNAHQTIEIEFPDGRKAAGKIRPITASEFKTIYNKNPADMLLGVLELGLLNKNGDNLPRSLIDDLPMGLLSNLAERIMAISGLELQHDEISVKDMMKNTELFP